MVYVPPPSLLQSREMLIVCDLDTSSSRRSYEDGPPCSSDFTTPGELAITPSLKKAFLATLQAHGLVIRFFAGSWDSFDLTQTGGKYDVVLTSETIYQTDNLQSLVNLLARACGHGGSELDHVDQAESNSSLDSSTTLASHCLCLVAAKVLYFGVGGSVSEFVRVVEKTGSETGKMRGKVENVWERKIGVGRKVMKVIWAKNA